MGCLKVNISQVSCLESVSIKDGSDLSFSVKMLRKKIGKCFRAVFSCLNDIAVSTFAINDAFGVSAEYACSKPKIDIGIVCMTNLDTECYLQVLDGYLVTIDGCYIKVMKG